MIEAKLLWVVFFAVLAVVSFFGIILSEVFLLALIVFTFFAGYSLEDYLNYKKTKIKTEKDAEEIEGKVDEVENV